ncbi:hypothetical protein BDP27DRAFT_1365272 [Rhodocollybia butyracea]|uniref:Peptidase S53 domain-containing protein n=1 Tax=Rhodocollybia butyracea TaxID=206335 RepID=A0A9P5PPL2_9AGAR|nr:hypothetical protein BDP27DRAFT_1365272 [Rhodocollybia butyracea]
MHQLSQDCALTLRKRNDALIQRGNTEPERMSPRWVTKRRGRARATGREREKEQAPGFIAKEERGNLESVRDPNSQLHRTSLGDTIINLGCNSTIVPSCLEDLYGIPTTPATHKSNKPQVNGYNGEFAQAADLQSFISQFQPLESPTTTFVLHTIDSGENPQADAGTEANLDIQYGVGVTISIEPEQAISFTGGVFRNVFSQPSFQDVAVKEFLSTLPSNFPGIFNYNGRGYPDVAMQFRSVVGLLNDRLVAAGKPVLGFLNPFLYSTTVSSTFTSITVGRTSALFVQAMRWHSQPSKAETCWYPGVIQVTGCFRAQEFEAVRNETVVQRIATTATEPTGPITGDLFRWTVALLWIVLLQPLLGGPGKFISPYATPSLGSSVKVGLEHVVFMQLIGYDPLQFHRIWTLMTQASSGW